MYKGPDGGALDPVRPLPPRHRLYRNLGDWKFADVTVAAGLECPDGYGMGCAVGDYDGDGFPDLYVTQLGSNRLYRNQGNGPFADVTAKAGGAGMHGVVVDPGLGFNPPLHFLLNEATCSAAIEFRPVGMSIVDNPTGVGTNGPFLDWHITNLRNYVGISAVNPTTTVGDNTLHPLGQGGGLRGLHGDYTPPSRFVRAAALVLLID